MCAPRFIGFKGCLPNYSNSDMDLIELNLHGHTVYIDKNFFKPVYDSIDSDVENLETKN